ncbi:MAG: T9SS type A sorting domain-containing protein [Ferruginibacter sp.]
MTTFKHLLIVYFVAFATSLSSLFAQNADYKLRLVTASQFPSVIVQGTSYNFSCKIVNVGNNTIEGGISFPILMSVNNDAGQALETFTLPSSLAPNDTFNATINDYQFGAERFGGGGGPINDITLWPPLLSIPNSQFESLQIQDVVFLNAAAFSVQNRTVTGLPMVLSFNKLYAIDVVAENVGIEASTDELEFYAQINQLPAKHLATLNVTVPVGGSASNKNNYFKLSEIFKDITNQINFSASPVLYIWAIEKDKNNVVSRAKFRIETNVFPVVLSQFQGVSDAEQHLNRISWVTYSEDGNKEFHLLKWNEATKDFEPLGIIEGAGTTNQAKHYTFLDKSPNYQHNRYQLLQYDLDGGHENLGEISVNYQSPKQSLQVLGAYPNPITTTLNLHIYNQTDRKIRLQIFDSQGKMVVENSYTEMQGTQLLSVPLTELPDGLYFYQLSNGIDKMTGQFGKVK